MDKLTRGWNFLTQDEKHERLTARGLFIDHLRDELDRQWEVYRIDHLRDELDRQWEVYRIEYNKPSE